MEACHWKNNQSSFLPLNGNIAGCWKNIAKLFFKMKLNGNGLNRLIMGKVGKGDDIRFWIDTWVGDFPFMERWPNLFGLEKFKSCRVAERMEAFQENGVFSWQWSRQPESDEKLQEWQECIEVLSLTRLSNDKDA
ncbi:hypothetical protein Hanom_Chr02g00098371 [Helianthus anomalus]